MALPSWLAFVSILFAIADNGHAQAPPPADPRRDEQAKRLAEQGFAYYDIGDYEHAIASFKEAYVARPTPRLLFNIAQAYRLLGPVGCKDALSFYERYLALEPQTPYRATVEAAVLDARECAQKQTQPPPFVATPVAEAPPAAVQTSEAKPFVFGWDAVAIASGGFGLAVVAGILAHNRQGDLDDACPSRVCPASRAGDVHAYNAWRYTSGAGLLVGVAGIGLGVWRIAWDF